MCAPVSYNPCPVCGKEGECEGENQGMEPEDIGVAVKERVMELNCSRLFRTMGKSCRGKGVGVGL